MSKKWYVARSVRHTTSVREKDPSNRQVRVNSLIRVANPPTVYPQWYVTLPWKSTSSAERNALDTSGDTPQFRGEHTLEETPQEQKLRSRHFTPSDSVGAITTVRTRTMKHNQRCTTKRNKGEETLSQWPRGLLITLHHNVPCPNHYCGNPKLSQPITTHCFLPFDSKGPLRYDGVQ